jgi:hypothetical protein
MARPGLCFFWIKGGLGGSNLRVAPIGRYWDRALRSLFLAFFFVSFLGPGSFSWAETAPNTELEGILRKIESRHYRWIAIRADVLLFFAKTGNLNAMCGGELLYQRLDERMFLTCVDAQQELTFAFRTLDRRFDLYLPSQNTVYHGSIFDLEDSPDIESHLKARDLYRALKPMAVDSRRTKIERTNSAITSLNVYGRNETKETLERKLYLTPEGDVRGELFYDSKERPVTEIQRYDFRELQGHVGAYDSFIFPKKITITSPGTKKGSAIFFSRVTALDAIDPLNFLLRVPPGTKEIFLDEKDPRFAPPTPANNLKTAKKTPLSNPTSLKNTGAAPQLKSETKFVKKVPQPPLRKKGSTPKSEGPQKSQIKISTKTVSPVNAGTDTTTVAQPAAGPISTPNDQTTLDPSVEPSVEMGKQ